MPFEARPPEGGSFTKIQQEKALLRLREGGQGSVRQALGFEQKGEFVLSCPKGRPQRMALAVRAAVATSLSTAASISIKATRARLTSRMDNMPTNPMVSITGM